MLASRVLMDYEAKTEFQVHQAVWASLVELELSVMWV